MVYTCKQNYGYDIYTSLLSSCSLFYHSCKCLVLHGLYFNSLSLVCVCVYGIGHVHVKIGVQKSKKRTSEPLEEEDSIT